MRLIRFVAPEEINEPIAPFDGAADRRQIREPPRLMMQRFRSDPRLIRVHGSRASQVIFGGDGRAIDFQPAQSGLILFEQRGEDFSMKMQKPLRGKTARPPATPPASLMEVDEDLESALQFLGAMYPVHHRAAAAKVIAIQPPQLLAMSFREHRQIAFPRVREARAANNVGPGVARLNCPAAPDNEGIDLAQSHPGRLPTTARRPKNLQFPRPRSLPKASQPMRGPRAPRLPRGRAVRNTQSRLRRRREIARRGPESRRARCTTAPTPQAHHRRRLPPARRVPDRGPTFARRLRNVATIRRATPRRNGMSPASRFHCGNQCSNSASVDRRTTCMGA